jgi:hypothetical protein
MNRTKVMIAALAVSVLAPSLPGGEPYSVIFADFGDDSPQQLRIFRERPRQQRRSVQYVAGAVRGAVLESWVIHHGDGRAPYSLRR